MKPILFNTEMTRAILEGRKTATRRKVDIDIINSCDIDVDGSIISVQDEYGDFHNIMDYAPHQIGDVLYVRETWRPAEIKCDGGAEFFYFADGFSDASDKPETGRKKWHPSIHMPKEAARIFLKVTDVRVERLQDITEEDAWKEGVSSECITCKLKNDKECKDCANHHQAYYLFQEIWDSTIKKENLHLYGWNANPYVWVIEFERCEKPESEG